VDVLEGELQGDQFDRAYVEKLRGEAAKYRTNAREWEQFVERNGGKDYVERLVGSTRTPEGVMALWTQAGQALGLSMDDMNALVQGQPLSRSGKAALAAAAEETEDDDHPITKKELENYLREMSERVTAPLEAQRQQDMASAGARTIFQTLDNLGVTNDEDRSDIIMLAEQIGKDMGVYEGGPREYDPQALEESIKAAHELFNTRNERRAQDYLKRKREASEAPAGMGGGSSAAFELPAEPKNTAEASKMMRSLLSRRAE
jgi:hypothetical protein